jgi:hypothetical protein
MIPDHQLNSLLRQGRVPEPPSEFWDELPYRVVREVGHESPPPVIRESRMTLRWGFGLAAACALVALWFLWGAHPTKPHDATDVAVSRKLFREIQEVFPDRLRGIVIEGQSLTVLLAEEPRRTDAGPLLVELCGRGPCLQVITFSGEAVAFEGTNLEVLAGAHGEVHVVGPGFVWSSATPRKHPDELAIRAKALEEAL